MAGMRMRLGTIFVFALLTACGANTLRVESAASVSSASSAMVAQARASLDYAKARREEANATLIASDPSCSPGNSVLLFVPGPDWKAGKRPPPLCAKSNWAPAGYRVQRVDLRPISEEALKPTLLLIGAVADYGGVLGKIAERPDADIEKELGAIAAKASEASSIANSLLGIGLPDAAEALASKQGQSALAILKFVETLSAEARRVRDIRKIVAKHGDEIERTIPQLREQLNDWMEISAEGDAQEVVTNLSAAYDAQRGRMDFDKRLAFVRLINQAEVDVRAVPARKAALLTALDEFQQAQAQLRDHLAGRFSEEDRRRIARINRQRMLDAIALVARTLTAFGVV